MNSYNMHLKHHGEQSLAAEVLKIVPLIEKHFKPFNSQRIRIQSGNSAKFNTVCKSFYDELSTISKARVYVDVMSFSVYVKIDINEPCGDHTCEYYKTSCYIGKPVDNNFVYDFAAKEKIDYCNIVLNTSIQQIESAREKYEEVKKHLSAIESSVPYIFQCLITN